MAATFGAEPNILESPQAIGQFKVSMRTFVPDSSYPAGGYPVTAKQLGLAKVLFIMPVGNGGYVVQYDSVNAKMQVFRQSAATSALTEPTGVDLSASTFHLLAFGY